MIIPELNYMNTSVDPCENFYQYTCGNFKNVHPLRESEYNSDHFTILQDEIHQLAADILKSTRKETDPVSLQKAKAAYSACLNINYADKLVLPEVSFMLKHGIWPVISLEDTEVEISWNLIGDFVAEYGVPLFFNFQILSNYWDPTDNFIYLYRDAISNPSTFYGKLEQNLDDFLGTADRVPRSVDSKSEPIPFESFLRTVAFYLRDVMGTWKGDEAIIEDVAEIISFMRVLQPGGLVEDTAEILPLDNLITVGELQEWTDSQFGEDYPINWVDYFNHLFKASGATITKDVKFYHDGARLLYGVLNLFQKAESRLLKNFIIARLFTYMAPDSDQVLREAFDTYYTNQGYTVYNRPQYCLRKILGYPNNIEYSMAVTHEYQKYHFNINKLQQAAEMIDDIHSAFKEILIESDWMDEQTKLNALTKADGMITLLGYPEFVENAETLDEYYDDLRICTWEHFWNTQRARSRSQALNFEQITLPRNRELWTLSPLEVNGYYNRATNRIMFPVSMLNPTFFDGSISALDYGRIGAIIGHEITHGFDANGKNYNEEGVMVNWWSTDTAASFSERTACFVEQYAKYYIDEIDVYVDASKTLNENLADNGGVRAAYKAFQKLKSRSVSVKTIEEFTPEQLFFIGFGTMWCMVETDYYLEQMYKSNSYPPGRYRVIGALSNMDEFAEAFNCPVGSNMNPVDKCILW
ncbi:zinc metalloprotease family m13 neprilysin-related [Holotrichia oblita]|uniref:Zinc metalloprotease family m13 neprilysin-related n=1 Tax=Holotrichia oblita TaxID=644536 RepID=A0ACB9SKM1_HOLOL|nr:zinc metalloprotease family m13 neprilysin-related [Holotrichia oblita]